MAERRSEAEIRLLAEVRTVLVYAAETGDCARLVELAWESRRRADIGHSARLSIECDLQALVSRSRAIADSVPVWRSLEHRAAALLTEDDPTLMSIRSMHAQYVRRRGEPGDDERGVQMYRAERARRAERLGPDDPRTGIACTNHALALRERGRPSDVEEALRILEQETLGRLRRHGAGHPFTWKAQIILAQTKVRAAERATDEDERRHHAQEAFDIAHALLDARRRRYGGSDSSTLNARLVQAQALLLLNQTAAAVTELHAVRNVSRRPGMDPGWPEFLLAQALSADSPTEALTHAREAQRLREHYYPQASRPVQEARNLVNHLTNNPTQPRTT